MSEATQGRKNPDIILMLNDGAMVHVDHIETSKREFEFIDTHLVAELGTYLRIHVRAGFNGLILIHESGAICAYPDRDAISQIEK